MFPYLYSDLVRELIWYHNHPYNYSPFQLRKPNTYKKKIMRVNMVYIWLMDSPTMSNLGSATKGRCEFVFLIWSASILLIYSALVNALVVISWILPCPVLYSLEFFLSLWKRSLKGDGSSAHNSWIPVLFMKWGLLLPNDPELKLLYWLYFPEFYYLFLNHSTNIRRYFSTFQKFHSRIFRGGVEEFLGEGNGNPLQYSCMENPMDGGAW